jgi:hypothetical protein
MYAESIWNVTEKLLNDHDGSEQNSLVLTVQTVQQDRMRD